MSAPDFSVTQTVTIGAGASLSGASTKYPGFRLLAVMTASTWDAAKLTFEVSNDGTNFFTLTKEGTEYEVASVTAAKAIALETSVFLPWDYIKVRSGTSAAAVNQVDATIVTLVLMPI